MPSSPKIVTVAVAMVASLATLPIANAANVNYDWNVQWVPDVNPNGLQSRRVIGVNGQWPMPVINVNSTDVLSIKVTNQLNDGSGTALHSHGMFFNQTSFYDGAVGVTQCPIPPGQTITYEPLNSPTSPADRQKQWGTYWTHGHHMGQYVDGFRTPSIIHRSDAPEAHVYDDDYTLALGDWYHREHDDLVKNEFLNEKNPTGAEPVPKSALVYAAHTSVSLGQNPTILPGFNENMTLPFVPGKTYRIRVINMAALAMFHVYFEGHDMRIIEVDGTDTEELPVDVLTVSVAQRYSVLVTARNDTSATVKNWPIHINMDPDMFDVVPDDLQLNVTSTVAYPGATEMGSDRPLVDAYTYFDDTKLVPVEVEGMADPDEVIDLNVTFDTYSDGQNYASFNNVTYVAPQTPALLTATSMGALASNKAVYGPDSNTHVLDHMSMVQVTIYNWDAGTHPFHLHGHKFQIVHKSMDVTSDDPMINPPFNPNQTNPVRRDTVTIHSVGSATIRFRADNPGAWLMHCHIDWHLSSGLVAIFMEGTPEIQSTLKVPQLFADQCQQLGISPTGNAGGKNSTTNFGTLRKAPHYLVTGWTPKAVGAFVGCILTALVGFATLIMYAVSGPVDDEEEQEAERDAGQRGLAQTPDEK